MNKPLTPSQISDLTDEWCLEQYKLITRFLAKHDMSIAEFGFIAAAGFKWLGNTLKTVGSNTKRKIHKAVNKP